MTATDMTAGVGTGVERTLTVGASAWLYVGAAHLFWILGAVGMVLGRQPVDRPEATFEPRETSEAIGIVDR